MIEVRLRLLSAAAGAALSLAVPPAATAQVNSAWSATYVDPALAPADDFATAAAIDANGDVYAATWSVAPPATSSNFLKYGANGALLWSTTQGPSGVYYLDAFAEPSGGALFFGRLDAVSAPGGSWVVTRIDAAGALVWTDTYAANAFSSEHAYCVRDAAGGAIVVGTRDSLYNARIFVRSYSPSGALNYHSEFNSLGWTRLFDAAPLLGGVVVCGTTYTGGVVAAISPSGTLLWSRNPSSAVWSLDVDERTGSIAVFESPYMQAATSSAVHVFDSTGSELWSGGISGPGWQASSRLWCEFASDGALWLAGTVAIAGVNRELLLRYDSTGTRTLTRVGGAPNEASGRAIVGAAGQIWLTVSRWANSSPTSARVEQIDVLGNTNWRQSLGSPMAAAVASSGGRIVAVGTNSWMLGVNDAYVESIDARGSPDGYCSAQVNSLGCTPNLVFAGSSSASASSGFAISVSRLVNQTTGLFFYGTNGSAAVPFLGGTLCVAGPLRRCPLLATGGNAAPAHDCSGSLSLDFNAFASTAPALQQPGATVYVQAWSRDPSAIPGTNLSSALHYVVLP
jgi:hypothetical protein